MTITLITIPMSDVLLNKTYGLLFFLTKQVGVEGYFIHSILFITTINPSALRKLRHPIPVFEMCWGSQGLSVKTLAITAAATGIKVTLQRVRLLTNLVRPLHSFISRVHRGLIILHPSSQTPIKQPSIRSKIFLRNYVIQISKKPLKTS